jgi:phosphonopyruvate decarboxylase
MTKAEDFYRELQQLEMDFYTGVPDSLMKGFLSFIDSQAGLAHYITVNEGAAIALGVGYHLATGKVPLVYLQNSGLGNIINPVTSLADKDIYGIPMLLLIGWRGQPGHKDEPQHVKMGRITLDMLDVLEIPYFILQNEKADSWKLQVREAMNKTKLLNHPVALVVSPGFFEELNVEKENSFDLSVIDVLNTIHPKINCDIITICTTGKIGRTYFDVAQKQNPHYHNYFLNVGAMGYAGSIASGLCLYTSKHILVIDGDGSFLMHMGSITMPGQKIANNFTYLLLNNGAHQSVGAQQTIALDIDICNIAESVGFESVISIKTKAELEQWVQSDWFQKKQFVEVKINTQVPNSLPRPHLSPDIAKKQFTNFIQNQT